MLPIDQHFTKKNLSHPPRFLQSLQLIDYSLLLVIARGTTPPEEHAVLQSEKLTPAILSRYPTIKRAAVEYVGGKELYLASSEDFRYPTRLQSATAQTARTSSDAGASNMFSADPRRPRRPQDNLNSRVREFAKRRRETTSDHSVVEEQHLAEGVHILDLRPYPLRVEPEEGGRPPPPTHEEARLPPRRITVGLIDYLRPYTWDKQVEVLV